jgi:hypothetical protein
MRINARVTDALHLTLDRPLALAPGSRVTVEVMPPDGEADALTWASASLLDRAYGPDEPDYSDAGEPLDAGD